MADELPALDRPRLSGLAELETCAASATRLLKLFASEQRLVLLCRLAEGECSVGDLATYLGLAPAAASQHLAKLRAEGVVDTRRDGHTIFYRVADPAALQLLGTLREIYRK
jgi:DNA-binding transcriptional ArsR family regulator